MPPSVTTGVRTPLWPIVLMVPLGILAANLVAAIPARRASGTHPALVLRVE